MALTWTSKPAEAVYRLTWTVPVIEGDSVSSAVLTVTDGDAAIDSYSTDGNDVIAFVSGGTAGTTTTIEASAETSDGETITETIYLPIRDSAAAAGNTVQDVVAFALRPIVGIGADAEGEEAEQGLEAFNDMVAEWRIDGLDVGIPGPCDLATVLVIRDEFLSALKFNLRVRIADEYGFQLPAASVATAQRAKMLVENALFTPADLTFEQALRPSRQITWTPGL